LSTPELLTRIGHGLFGFISTLSVLVHPILPALSAALFLSTSLMRVFISAMRRMLILGSISMVLQLLWLFSSLRRWCFDSGS
jgi:hypothetical protein